MAKDRPDYLIGDKGVNLVASPLHTPQGGLLSSQNVEFIREQGIGGIGSRGGLARLNSTALAGAVRAAANIPLALPGDTTLLLACDTGETETWKTSVSGTSWTDLLAAVIARMASISKFPDTITPATIPPTQRIATFKGKLYFPGDDYVITDAVSPYVSNTAAPLLSFDGVLSNEQFRVPANPVGVGPCRWITDLWVNNGVIYLAVWDYGGVAPDHKGRVLAYHPETGLLTQIANSWGDGTDENQQGMPFCLTSFGGYLWAGTYGVTAAGTLGNLYRILPGAQAEWKLDHSAVASSGYFMSLCEYNGNLYAASNATDAGFAPRVEKRTAAGVWSTSFTGPDTGVDGYCSSLIVFDGNLYAAYFRAGVRSLVKTFDGTTWTTDKDVGVDLANLNAVPGAPFVFEDNLYWPFSQLTAAAQTGFVLKRTTGGTWSTVLTGVSLRGALNTYVDG